MSALRVADLGRRVGEERRPAGAGSQGAGDYADRPSARGCRVVDRQAAKALFAIGQVFGINPTRLANEDTQTLLPVFGDQDRYAETEARLKKQLRSIKAVR